MNKVLETKLINVLKAEAKQTIESQEEILIRISKMNDIENMLKIIQNYEELTPVLAKFFEEKYNKEKWEER